MLPYSLLTTSTARSRAQPSGFRVRSFTRQSVQPMPVHVLKQEYMYMHVCVQVLDKSVCVCVHKLGSKRQCRRKALRGTY